MMGDKEKTQRKTELWEFTREREPSGGSGNQGRILGEGSLWVGRESFS